MQLLEQAAGSNAQTLVQLPSFTPVSLPPLPVSKPLPPSRQLCTTVASCCAHCAVLTWTPPTGLQEYCDDEMPLAHSR